jgi:hypothetical protein
MEIDNALNDELNDLYEEIMWLAARPRVTASFARAWYTHVRADFLKRRIRRFSGFVSERAVSGGEPLRLEHFERIQTTLTALVSKHLEAGVRNSKEFVETLVQCERVHIVTFKENYLAMSAKDDYEIAGIELLGWDRIEPDRRGELWKAMLRGKVSNAQEFRS